MQDSDTRKEYININIKTIKQHNNYLFIIYISIISIYIILTENSCHFGSGEQPIALTKLCKHKCSTLLACASLLLAATLTTFRPVWWIFSVNWSTATFEGAHTRTLEFVLLLLLFAAAALLPLFLEDFPLSFEDSFTVGSFSLLCCTKWYLYGLI